MPLRLLIIDDSSDFRAAARGLLEREGIDVVAVASTSAEALARARELRPDVALIDIDLGEESGVDVAWKLARAAHPDPARLILISAYPEADLRELIDASPAVGFLSKSRLSARAIRTLLDDAPRHGPGPG
jgi:DNA-binding NarL/FixJ family response regulator